MTKKLWNRLICAMLAFVFVTLGSLYPSSAFATERYTVTDYGYPPYPSDGQTYWIVFKEGYRSSRLEMTTFDVENIQDDTCILWDKNLVLNDRAQSSRCNQYAYAGSTWENIGTYHVISDWATAVIASNLNVYDANGILVVRASEYDDLVGRPAALDTIDDAIGERSFFFENGHTYAIFDLGTSSWEWANVYCGSLGGHMATITSEEENSFLTNLVASAGVKNAYIGLTDEENEGEWNWVTGEPFLYSNWHSGEPNSENSKEDYAMFYWKWADGTWNDGDFGNRTVGGGTTFICEWDYDAREVSTVSQGRYMPDYEISLGKRIANLEEYRDGTIGECVWYVRGRAQEKLGVNTGISGDAYTWWGQAVKNTVFKTGSEIQSNSIACFSGPYASGHVVFVEHVSEDWVYYTEANVERPYSDGEISPKDGVLQRKTREDFESMCNNTLQGYLYLE